MPSQTTTRQRQDEALRLRQLGYTLREIADRLGYSQTGQVSRAVAAASSRAAAPTRRALRRNPFDRTFGVEIELVGLSTTAAARALENAGIACENRGYTHQVMRTWKAVTDASVPGGCEVVSPILRGEDGLAEVARVMEALRNAGGHVNRSTGMHIHIGVEDLTGAEMAQVLDFYETNADAFDGLVAPSRRNSHWSGKYSGYEKTQAVEQLKATSNLRNFRTRITRYKAVNLHSLQRYGTVEFRQHQGTLNGVKATAWIRLLLATVCEASQMETVERTPTATSLVQRMGAHLGTSNAKTYLLGRAAELAS